MTLLAFVTQLVLEPVMVFVVAFGANHPLCVSLRFEMRNTRDFVGELRTEFNDIQDVMCNDVVM